MRRTRIAKSLVRALLTRPRLPPAQSPSGAASKSVLGEAGLSLDCQKLMSARATTVVIGTVIGGLLGIGAGSLLAIAVNHRSELQLPIKWPNSLDAPPHDGKQARVPA